MKDYMMIFIGEDYGDIGLSPEQIQERMGKWYAWHEKMEAAGIVKHGEALHPEVKRVSGTEMTVTDVASTEIKELVGGYYVIKAESADEVAEICKDFPDYDLGSFVEIREIMVFDQ